jgi:(4S)-4-hydroxy-5-phosphonooxypentane-2,3-dione isomerase
LILPLACFYFKNIVVIQREGDTIYVIVVRLEIRPEHRQDFIKAAFQDGRDSNRNEPGTQRFEFIQDESNPNCFYLSEAYEDRTAFEAHANEPYFQAFAPAASGYYAEKPVWLVKGTLMSPRRNFSPSSFSKGHF